MKRLGLYILILGIILCATVLDTTLVDQATGIRNMIWCAATILMVLVVIFTRWMDFGALKNWMMPAFLGFFLMTAFSMTQAINVSESFYVTSRVFLSLVFLALAILFMDRMAMAKVLTIMGIALGLYGFWFLVFSPFGKQIGTMCNRNLWSMALFLLLPFCVYAIKEWRYIGLLGSVLITANILMLSTRSVLVGLFVFCFTLMIYKKRKLGIALFLIVAVLIAVRFRTNTTGMKQRFVLWSKTAKMIRPFGIGAGNWRVIFPWYCSDMPGIVEMHTKRFVRSPHNDYVWVFSETGAGGVFFLSIFAAAIYYARKKPVILAGLLGCMAIGFFSFAMSRAFLWIMFLILLSFTVDKGKPLFISRREICLAGSLVIVSLSVVMFGFAERYRMGRHAKIIRWARKQGDWSTVREHTKRMSWFYTLDTTSMPLWFYKGEAKFYTADTTGALLDFMEAYNHNPTHIHNLNNMATCLVLHGLYEEAITCLKRAQKVRPDLALTRHNLKAVYARMGVE